jgi:hypothetical protein
MVLDHLLFAVFRAARAKPHTIRKRGTALPKAKLATCVSPNFLILVLAALPTSARTRNA